MAFLDLKRALSFRLGRTFGPGFLVTVLISSSVLALSCAADLQGAPEDYRECAYQGACATGGSTGGGAAVPPDDACLAPLFAKSCNICHSTQGAPTAGDLALDTPNLGASLVGRKATYKGVSDPDKCKAGGVLIDATNNAESVLLKKLTTPDCGLKMPYGLQPLSGTDLTCIQDWVMKF